MYLYNVIDRKFIDFSEWKLLPKEIVFEYFEQFMSVIPLRVYELSCYVKSNAKYKDWIPDFSRESLSLLGEWLYENYNFREYTKEEQKIRLSKMPTWVAEIESSKKHTLSDETKSLCVDIGMYLGMCFIKQHQGVFWKLLTKPKNAYYFQEPVVFISKKNFFNPIGFVEVCCLKFIRNEAESTCLVEVFESNFW